MQELPIGLIIKTIVKKKNLSVAKLSGKMGMTRQGVYNAYSRTTMDEDEIEKWAKALEVAPDELTPSDASSTSSDEVLALVRKMFEEELREKNEQIRALQKALEQAQNLSTVLLGKSPEYSDRSIIPLHRNRIQALAGV